MARNRNPTNHPAIRWPSAWTIIASTSAAMNTGNPNAPPLSAPLTRVTNKMAKVAMQPCRIASLSLLLRARPAVCRAADVGSEGIVASGTGSREELYSQQRTPNWAFIRVGHSQCVASVSGDGWAARQLGLHQPAPECRLFAHEAQSGIADPVRGVWGCEGKESLSSALGSRSTTTASGEMLKIQASPEDRDRRSPVVGSLLSRFARSRPRARS